MKYENDIYDNDNDNYRHYVSNRVAKGNGVFVNIVTIIYPYMHIFIVFV